MPRTVTWTSTEQPVASARRRPRRNPASASASGSAGSNSIDDLVPRPVLDWRDANTDWNDDASDGTLEERIYYCQNWRHDVVALVTSGGALRERVRYTAYGIPVGMPQGDCDGDGDVDAADQSILLGAWGTATAKCDLNLDGTVDATDNAILLGQLGATAGFGRLSLSGNRFGYAGYASDPAVHADWHVRHRVLMAELGRWSTRDPIGYADGASLYCAVRSNPLANVDTYGLCASAACAGGSVPRRPDCSSWDRRHPPNRWTRPGAPNPEPPIPEEYRRRCEMYDFPPSGLPDNDACYCWERRRIIEKHGFRRWLGTGDCALEAYTRSGDFPEGSCRNNYRHCLYSCCLSIRHGREIAEDILWAHECCAAHGGFHDYSDSMQDIRWNAFGLGCNPNPYGKPGGAGAMWDWGYSHCDNCCKRQLRDCSCGSGHDGGSS